LLYYQWIYSFLVNNLWTMRTILISLIIVLICTCQKDKFVTIEQNYLDTAFILNSSPTFKGYYYLGTDNDFHYFMSKWTLQKDKYFKIRIKDLNIIEPYNFGDKEVLIDLIEDSKKVFGQNNFYTLYVD
jgi:hypothetical protein